MTYSRILRTGTKTMLSKDVFKIYKCIYVESKAAGYFSSGKHRELIDEYCKEGWKFITAIPTIFNILGVIKQYDLVFEKEV